MPSGISYQNNIGTTTQLSCSSPQDVCNIIANEWNMPFRNPRQIGYYTPANKLDGLKKLIFNTVNLFGANGLFSKDSVFTNSRYEQDGTRVIQTMYNNPTIRTGIRVASVPRQVNGLPVGNRTVRSGLLRKSSRIDNTRFILNSDIIKMTMNDVNATQIPYDPVTNTVDLVIPESFGIFASDDKDCGCSPTCCGNGYRKLFFFDPATKRQETMWIRTQPPAGKGGVNPYGKVTVLAKSGYRLYAIRGVGASATVNTPTLLPTDYGTPIILREGVVVELGPVIPLTQCLPCGTPFREKTTTQVIENGIEEMTGSIWCIDKRRLDTLTYHQDGMIMEIQEAMVRVNNEIMNNLLYSQRGILAGTGNPLSDGSTPYNGVGTGETCNTIPHQTDGLMTLIDKVGTHLRVPITEGCDNICLINDLKQLIEQLTHGALQGYVLIGSDMLFEYIRTMINNRVTAVATPQVAGEMLFGGTMANYLYDDQTKGTIIDGVGNGMQVDYKYLNIAGLRLPFFYDPELERKYPGRLYLAKLDAMEIWYPDGELERSWNFREPSRIPGTIIPNIEVKGVTSTIMNGREMMLATNDCPISFDYYLKAGAWYDMEAAPQTLIIDFYGIKDGAVVPIEDVACGCFRNRKQLYGSLQGF